MVINKLTQLLPKHHSLSMNSNKVFHPIVGTISGVGTLSGKLNSNKKVIGITYNSAYLEGKLNLNKKITGNLHKTAIIM